jgi:Flp pilus assembly protein TadB
MISSVPIHPGVSAVLALTAVLLGLLALAWEPACALVRLPAPMVRRSAPDGKQRAANRIPDPFRFTPALLDQRLLTSVMIATGAVQSMVAITLVEPILLVTTPLSVFLVRSATIAIARARYRRRLSAQLPALQSLTSLMEGGRTMLVGAFATTAATLPEPLGTEWRWALDRLNQPYLVTRPDGAAERYTSTHTAVLDRLAAQTPVRLHAQVLDQIVAMYEHQLDAQAHARLAQITTALARRETLQRAVTTLLGRIRGEAYVITGAFSAMIAWLAWSQTERLIASFTTDMGLLALIWFGCWLVAPVVFALLAVRIPDLPL